MAKWVIKRGGKKEPFKASKITSAVRDACKDAKVPAKRTKAVVNKVSRPVLKFAAARKLRVRTSDLRKVALKHLDKVEPKAAKAWRKHDTARRARRAKARKRRRR
jgi:transcriptional regulator NrdR family protein